MLPGFGTYEDEVDARLGRLVQKVQPQGPLNVTRYLDARCAIGPTRFGLRQGPP